MITAVTTEPNNASPDQGDSFDTIAANENGDFTSSVDRKSSVAAFGASHNLNRSRRRVMASALKGLAPLTLEEREAFAGRDAAGKSIEARDLEGFSDPGRRYSVCGCMRHAAFGKSTYTAVQKASGRVHFKGINRCGSVWTCAECAQIIEAHRGEEVKMLTERAREKGYRLFMITYTFPHTINDTCKDSMTGLADALRKCRGRRGYRAVQAALGFVGLVRSTEVTHGSNGWHTHVHEIWVCESAEQSAENLFEYVDETGDINVSKIKSRLYPEWKKAAVSVFGKLRAPSYEHGLDVREVWSDTDYTNKLPDHAAAKKEAGKKRWGSDAEMTKTVVKRGKGSMTIWELMDNLTYYEKSGNEDMALVIRLQLEDYARGTYRKRRMYWTPTRTRMDGTVAEGLRDLFGISQEKTDEEIVNEAGEVDPNAEPDVVEVSIDVNGLPLMAKKCGLPDWLYLELLQDRFDRLGVLEVLKIDGWKLHRLSDREDGVPRWFAGSGPRLVLSK